MEPQVVISAIIGVLFFLGIVIVLWRMRNGAEQAQLTDTQDIPQVGVLTAELATRHESAPLVLSYEDGEKEDPTEGDISNALAGLQSNSDDTVMLDDADHTENYLQAYIDKDGSYCVEYHDGTNDRHYRAEPNPDFSIAQTLFFMFNRRDWDGLKRTSGWRDTTNSY
jgi:hypothetical protein